MKVTVLLVVTGAFGTVQEDLVNELEELEIEGRAKAIQSRAFLRSARILRRVEEI